MKKFYLLLLVILGVIFLGRGGEEWVVKLVVSKACHGDPLAGSFK